MTVFETALELLPERLRTGIADKHCENAEEIRLRTGRPPMLRSMGRQENWGKACVAERDIVQILEKATCASIHSALNTLKNGYIPYKRLRIGVCGRTLVKNGEICGFSAYTSLNIRIPSGFSGELSDIAGKISARPFENTLIVSSPGVGKTTALRELVRLISDSGRFVSVVDDRNEIFPEEASAKQGENTDVLSGTGKLEGAIILLKTMSPELIALDEISGLEDVSAVREIAGCGVGILATAHGTDAESMMTREIYRKLFEDGIFTYILEISMGESSRSYLLRRVLT